MANSNTNRTRSVKQKQVDAVLGHLPPQAVDVEKAVLGSLLIDRDAFTVVSEILHPETFYDPRHQKIYRAIQTLSLNEQPVDMLTVEEELKREGTHDEVGAPLYLAELTMNVYSAVNIFTHATILADKYIARQLISYASDVGSMALDEGQDIKEVMQNAEGALFQLSQTNIRQDYTQIDPVVLQARAMIEKAASNTGGITGVSTGYFDLDKLTSGWQDSDLIIIA